MTDTKTATPTSRHCAIGNHTRCLGTVFVKRRLVPCGCETPDCGHGTEEAKAKRAG